MEGIEDVVVRKGKAPIAVGILLAIILLASLRFFPLSLLALTGALIMVACGCLSAQLAYRAINWQILILIAGTISLGLAMEKTGLAELIAEIIVSQTSFLGHTAIIASLYLLTTTLTACISNTATAVLLTPIVINLASNLGTDPLPFLITIAFGASASFATPIGYQTNTMVYGAGGYRVLDFLKIGLPLNIIMWLVASLLIPSLWPRTLI